MLHAGSRIAVVEVSASFLLNGRKLNFWATEWLRRDRLARLSKRRENDIKATEIRSKIGERRDREERSTKEFVYSKSIHRHRRRRARTRQGRRNVPRGWDARTVSMVIDMEPAGTRNVFRKRPSRVKKIEIKIFLIDRNFSFRVVWKKAGENLGVIFFHQCSSLIQMTYSRFKMEIGKRRLKCIFIIVARIDVVRTKRSHT